jgi:hypothetical protein
VGVAVHESWHDDTAAGIDEIGVSRQGEILQTPAGTDIVNAAIDD